MTIPSAIPTIEHARLEGEGRVSIDATLTNGEAVTLFTYYSDELSFTAAEMIGKTVAEARTLFHQRNVAYLQS